MSNDQTETRPSSRRWPRFGVIASLLALGMVGLNRVIRIALYGRAEVAIGRDVTPSQRAFAEKQTQIKFPASAEVLYYRRGDDIDKSLSVQIRFPATDFYDFLDQRDLKYLNWNATDRMIDDLPDVPTWKPSLSHRFRSAQFDLPDEQSIIVLLTEDSSITKTVYIQWFGS